MHPEFDKCDCEDETEHRLSVLEEHAQVDLNKITFLEWRVRDLEKILEKMNETE